MIKAYSAKNNDMMFAIYICAMTRCILSLHTLMFVGKNNEEKVKDRELEIEAEKEKEKEKKERLEKREKRK